MASPPKSWAQMPTLSIISSASLTRRSGALVDFRAGTRGPGRTGLQVEEVTLEITIPGALGVVPSSEQVLKPQGRLFLFYSECG